MMTLKLTLALVAGLTVAACSNEPAAAPQSDSEVPASTAMSNAPADADDDSLEPLAEAPTENEPHDESQPHAH